MTAGTRAAAAVPVERTRAALTASAPTWFVLLVAVGLLLPHAVASFVRPKEFRPVTEEAVVHGAVEVAALLGNVVVLLATLAALLVGRRRLRHALPALLVVAAWAWAAAGVLVAGQHLPRSAALVPLVAVASAVVGPPHLVARAVGLVTGGVAAVAVAAGLLVPTAARYARPAELADEKPLSALGILAGPLPSGNNLGLVLAVGLPTVLLLRSTRGRWRAWPAALAATTVVLALLWTGSRTAWLAAAAAAGVGLLARVRGTAGHRLLGAALAAVGLVAVALPWVVRSDTAFTNRGLYWSHARETWGERPLLGHGADYYLALGRSGGDLGGHAYQAHNQAMHTLVTGGLGLLVLVVATLALASWVAIRTTDASGPPWAPMVLAALLVCATFEVPLGLVDRTMFHPWVLVLVCALLALSTSRPTEPKGLA